MKEGGIKTVGSRHRLNPRIHPFVRPIKRSSANYFLVFYTFASLFSKTIVLLPNHNPLKI